MPFGAEVCDEHYLIVRLWNWMSGEMKWDALPIFCDLYGFRDVEALITQLIAVRDYHEAVRQAEQ